MFCVSFFETEFLTDGWPVSSRDPLVYATTPAVPNAKVLYAAMPAFYTGARDLNSGPYGCTASSLPTKPSPQPVLILLKTS